MGLCGSKMTEEERRSKELDAANKKDFDVENAKIKLLLLGACDSRGWQRRTCRPRHMPTCSHCARPLPRRCCLTRCDLTTTTFG